ncbi:helix-turn-helix domain-containing protein [Streptomyces sp. NBC_00439]|uniref:helix-turn-helix domain-containing protein n=1 Tax=Streptomyces sp. NBC_00439 TaxID=2903650 RepID=UPI002256C021|nr:helix-turn-helix domain-containing protein [Streptomyces sp. NBC_00439]MCX5103461.1 helix-turn-helix domain-containing protein [Streptomyces sp. NBC_00439]
MFANEPDLKLTVVWPLSFANHHESKVAGISIVSVTEVMAGPTQVRLKTSSVVLLAGVLPLRLRGRTTAAVEVLLQRMAKQRCVALVVTGPAVSSHVFPQSLRDLSDDLGIPLMVTSAQTERWSDAHERIMDRRLAAVERRASQLNLLMQQLPTQLSDPKAMQRIADWLAQTLDAQVLVSEPTRVLASSPSTAAEHLAQAIIRQSMEDTHHVGQMAALHTQLISLAPFMGAETVLAVATRVPLSTADGRLIKHVAKILGLVDQARREYRAASDATRAARSVAFDLLLDGEVAKARRVMTNMVPGLLEPDTARVFVVETEQAHRDAAVRRCSAAIGHQALIVPDSRRAQRVLIVHPIRSEEDNGAAVSAELTHLVGTFGTHSSLGGSGVYSMTLLADALHEAITAQSFAALQPDSVALSVHGSDLVSLLPQVEAQHWARHLLSPLMQDEAQWESMRETLPVALAYPYTVAARRLHLHRNTVMRRAARAAELLHMNFGRVGDRVTVALALEMVTQREIAVPSAVAGSEPRSLTGLLAAPQVQAWAQALVRPVQADRRDLLATARAWLAFDTHVEPASRALGLSEVTVRSHLRALENHMQRDLTSLSGVRDLHVSLYVATGNPGLLTDHPDDGLRVVA